MIQWTYQHYDETRAASSSKNNITVMFETLKSVIESGDRQRMSLGSVEADKNESYALYSRALLWLVEVRLLVAFANLYTQPPAAMGNALTEYLPVLKYVVEFNVVSSCYLRCRIQVRNKLLQSSSVMNLPSILGNSGLPI